MLTGKLWRRKEEPIEAKKPNLGGDLNPEFEFTTGYVVEEGGASDLVIEIRDHDLGKDESLGHCSFDLRQVLGQVNVEMF